MLLHRLFLALLILQSFISPTLAGWQEGLGDSTAAGRLAVVHPTTAPASAPLHVAGQGCFAYARVQAMQRSNGQWSAQTQQHLYQPKLRYFLNEQSQKGIRLNANPQPGKFPSNVEKVSVRGTQRNVHGKSKNYVGDTHVYVIKDGKTGGLHKVGESMRGTNKQGLSIRAELQRRKLERVTGKKFETEIRDVFPDKKSALEWETRLIKRVRGMYGSDKLPGNKGVH